MKHESQTHSMIISDALFVARATRSQKSPSVGIDPGMGSGANSQKHHRQSSGDLQTQIWSPDKPTMMMMVSNARQTSLDPLERIQESVSKKKKEKLPPLRK